MAVSTLIQANTLQSPVEVASGTLHVEGTWGGASVVVLAGTTSLNGRLVGMVSEHEEQVQNLAFAESMHVSAILVNASAATNLTVRLVHP